MQVSEGQAGDLIEVTPAIIEAGLLELRDHTYGGDAVYMVECVFRAMILASDRSFVR